VTTPDNDWTPRPDPTLLTTQQLLREMLSLRELLETRFDGQVAYTSTRLDAFQLQIDQRFGAAQEAVQAALTSAKEAVTKAEIASEKRFEGVNEFRKTLSDQAGTFLSRTEYNSAQSALGQQIDANAERLGALELRLTSRLDRGEGADTGVKEQKTNANASMILITQVIVGIIAVTAVIISIVVHVH
jgi:hypothetical protein